jgi:hypothetical protein
MAAAKSVLSTIVVAITAVKGIFALIDLIEKRQRKSTA